MNRFLYSLSLIHILKAETRYIPKKVVPSVRGYFEEKIAIIGGGPAGLSCAFYLAEKGYKPTIFEKNERAGGMLVYGIPSFKLEKDVVQAEICLLYTSPIGPISTEDNDRTLLVGVENV